MFKLGELIFQIINFVLRKFGYINKENIFMSYLDIYIILLNYVKLIYFTISIFDLLIICLDLVWNYYLYFKFNLGF